jgi:hypothetical protein
MVKLIKAKSPEELERLINAHMIKINSDSLNAGSEIKLVSVLMMPGMDSLRQPIIYCFLTLEASPL